MLWNYNLFNLNCNLKKASFNTFKGIHVLKTITVLKSGMENVVKLGFMFYLSLCVLFLVHKLTTELGLLILILKLYEQLSNGYRSNS